MTNTEKALEFIKDGTVVGLGSGHASTHFIETLGQRVQAGLRIRAVPTSSTSAALATRLGIPLVSLADAIPIDVTVDGADEVDPQLNLIKGYGHALVRERIVAASSRNLVILIGPEHVNEKLVGTLGRRGKLPVEVVPFGLPLVQRKLAQLGCPGEPLRNGDQVFVSDNGNYIVECRVQPIADPARLERELLAIPGVVGTGLFLGMAGTVLIQDGDRLEVRQRS